MGGAGMLAAGMHSVFYSVYQSGPHVVSISLGAGAGLLGGLLIADAVDDFGDDFGGDDFGDF
jgi:hypothetical protein